MATAQVLQIPVCAICVAVHADPRVLPCGHSFCLDCVEQLSAGKVPGDQLACPVCKKKFILSRRESEIYRRTDDLRLPTETDE